MLLGETSTDEKVLVIAEIGNNHEGDLELAKEMIREAAKAGADAVKFQPIEPDKFVTSTDQARREQLKAFQLEWLQYQSLSNEANRNGVIFFSTAFDLDNLDYLSKLQSLFKIASGDNSFFPLIRAVASFGKPTLISTGLADIALVDRIYEFWKKHAGETQLAFLHCVSSYPVPLDQANLGAISTLKARYPGVTIGYSDHTIGIEAATLAVAAGARIIEKHFTLDKNFSDFRDHHLSADPEEFAALVKAVQKASSIVGTGVKVPQPCEDGATVSMRRSIAARIGIDRGEKIEEHHLTWLRPGSGLAPGNEDALIGKTLKVSARQGELITLDMCE